MCVLNPLNFGRDGIICRTHTFVYHKSLCVMFHVSLKAYILVVVSVRLLRFHMAILLQLRKCYAT